MCSPGKRKEEQWAEVMRSSFLFHFREKFLTNRAVLLE